MTSKIVCAVPTISSASATVASSIARRSPEATDVVPGAAEHAVAVDAHAVESTCAMRRLSSKARSGVVWRRGDRDNDRAHAVVAPRSLDARDDDELVDRVALDDEALLAVQYRPVVLEGDGRARGRGIERAGLLGDCERALHLAGGDRAEEPCSLLAGSRFAHRRHELRHRRQQRSGRDDPPELFGEDAGFDHAEPDAAVVLGDGERRPAQLGHRLPERGRTLVGLDDLAREGNRALRVSTARIESRSSS